MNVTGTVPPTARACTPSRSRRRTCPEGHRVCSTRNVKLVRSIGTLQLKARRRYPGAINTKRPADLYRHGWSCARSVPS
jgi:hypothetical protein